MPCKRLASAFALMIVLTLPAWAQVAPTDSILFSSLRWRPIGPANMSGRITDIEGLPSPSRTFYVAAAAGGIWKTSNGGTTFRPVFQTERVISLGDIAIAPSDSLQIWAGTGEEDSRNSISPGGGIYKSVDGGIKWTLMGLEKTEHIARVVVHPTNPDIVYVAALGAAWRSNPERGLYKTVDGGRTWQLSKFISDKAGFADLVMDPRDPNVLYAASYERVRGPYFMRSGGPGSALWKTTDAGATWTEVRGGGFPETNKGRIGLAVALSNPDVMYALVEAEKPAAGALVTLPDVGRFNCHNPQAGGCGLYRSQDGGKTWEWKNGHNVRPFYYSQVRVDVKNPDRVYWSSTPVQFSTDGGKTVAATTNGLHVDHHAMWMDPNNADHFIVGNDGGIAETWDKGGTYDFINTMPLGQFYNISYDMRVPYFVCGGLQDNGSWCGPSRKASNNNPITNADWYKVGGGDGFHTAQDPTDWRIVYYESQGGNMSRTDLSTGMRARVRDLGWLDRYRETEDSIVVQRGDTAMTLSAAQRQHLDVLRARQIADSAANTVRWNWNTPFFLSAHNSSVVYAGSNKVMKSAQRGDSLRAISGELSYADADKIFTGLRMSGGITKDTTGAEVYGTIVSLAESPIRAGTLFAGTDDGRLWSTVNDGGRWNEHTLAFAKLVPKNTYISRIEPSRVSESRFYITFDNHRNGDFTPYVLVTDDGGKTFRSIANNLPRGGPDFVHVIREDPVTPDILYLGTDVGLYVSLDRGAAWQRFMNGLPTVPVHDLKIHPRDRELIAGTHGRSIWIVDVAPLQQRAALLAAKGPLLLEPKPGLAYTDPAQGGEGNGHKIFAATSPSFGAEIMYYVPPSAAPAPPVPATAPAGGEAATASTPPGAGAGGGAGRGAGGRGRGPQARVFVLSASGDTLARLTGAATAGLQRVTWDMRTVEARRPLSPAERRDSVLMEPRIAFVVDSLVAAGKPRAAVDRLITQYRTGSFTGFGGGGGGGGGGGAGANIPGGAYSGALGAHPDRPGEVQPRTAVAPRAGEEPQLTTDEMRAIFAVLRLPGVALRTGGGGFGASQPFVAEGNYTVVLKIGEMESRTVVAVVKPKTGT